MHLLMEDRKLVYPDWSLVVFIDETVPEIFVKKLLEGGCDIVKVDPATEQNGMMWRFNLVALGRFERVIFRDADSRLTVREKLAVDAWMKSAKPLHIMRDHPFHRYPILGGMFGLIIDSEPGRSLASIKSSSVEYGSDINSLSNCLGNYLSPEFALIHDDFFKSFGGELPFPEGGSFFGYVGEVAVQPTFRKLSLRAIRLIVLAFTRVFGRRVIHGQ